MECLLLCSENILSDGCVVFMWFCFCLFDFVCFLFVFVFVTGPVSGPWDKINNNYNINYYYYY